MRIFSNFIFVAVCVCSVVFAQAQSPIAYSDAAKPPSKDFSEPNEIALSEHFMTETHSFMPNPGAGTVSDTGIPVSDTRNVSDSQIVQITDIEISLKLTNPAQGGAYNGDYYVALQHGSGFTVLLNRVGRNDGSSTAANLGYGDNGFNVTFRDDAPLGDIHNYRLTLEGSHDIPIDPTYNSPLSGEWAPDGRETSPLTVFQYDNRTALLSSFNGLGANGDWTLEVVDFNAGGVATIDGWSIRVAGIVPEPSPIALLLSAAAAIVARRTSKLAMHRTRSAGTTWQ